nr:putative late blight resistance protein homolog R1B-17 [Ipomoea batatas]
MGPERITFKAPRSDTAVQMAKFRAWPWGRPRHKVDHLGRWLSPPLGQAPCSAEWRGLRAARLRHLHLEKRYSQCFPSLIQENLQTLYWLKVASSDKNKNFKLVPQLKELGIYIEGDLVHGCLERLVHLHLLEKLKVEIGRVERFYLPTSFPPNLKQLTLHYTYVPWKNIHIVGKLPNLETLKLKYFAFCGSKWEQTEMGFKKLKVFLISRLDFTSWNASANHFPILEKLVLKYCWELKQVLIDFANIKTLNFIELENCYSSLVNSAHEIKKMCTYEIQRRGRRDELEPEFFVDDLGTKIDLPNNEIFEEESVECSMEDRDETYC